MAKEIKFSDNARSKMFKWIETVAKTVTVTMWPKWRNVILEKSFWAPQITNDGVTIAREIELEDKFENMWAELVKQAASNTNDNAWDGTTTATLLTYALAKEWLRSVRTWINAVELKQWMKKASQKVIEELKNNAKKIEYKEEIAQVAAISAQDIEVWNIIAEAMEKVWQDGVITVEEGQTMGLSVEITEWMQFENGFISPYMVSNPEKMIAEMKDAPILITDWKVSNIKELLPLLEELRNAWTNDLTIIADDIDWEALTTIILNKLKWVLNILAIKAPGFGDKKKEYIEDIAVLTWAKVISKEVWLTLESANIEYLWRAENVISDKDKTIIIWWKGPKVDIENRISQIKSQLANTDSSYEAEKLAERVAKLSGWVAVIKVWAASEVEMKEKKLRIEDALNATRAAVEEGVVAGWWVALLKASKAIIWTDFGSTDENIWAEIVANALTYPISQIAENSGKQGAVIVNDIKNSPNVNYGYDARTDEFKDMLEAGIIDPTKVERIALENAVSLAWMFLTTEAALVEIKWEDDVPMPPMWGGMGMPWMM